MSSKAWRNCSRTFLVLTYDGKVVAVARAFRLSSTIINGGHIGPDSACVAASWTIRSVWVLIGYEYTLGRERSLELSLDID